MIRFTFRLIAMIFLAVAVMYGVIDIARSIADTTVTLTPLSNTVALIAPDGLVQLEQQVADGDHRFLKPGMLATALSVPTSLVALVLAFLFYLIGRKPKRQKGRFSID